MTGNWCVWLLLLASVDVPADAVPRAEGVASDSVMFDVPPVPGSPRGMPNSRATFAPPFDGVAVTVAEEPAARVVAETVSAGVVPLMPAVPRGIANDSVRLLPFATPVTLALPLSSVVVLPTVTFVAGPAGMPMSSFAAYAVPASFFTYACDPAASVVVLLIASVPLTTVALPGEIVPVDTLTAPPLPTMGHSSTR